MKPANNSLEIRAAQPDDAPALSGLVGELGFPTSATVIAERLGALDLAGETVLVCARNDDVLGIVTVHVTPVLHRPTPVGRVTMLVVTARARGQGVGRALVEAAEQHVTRAGCALMEVTSNQARPDAHAFYQRVGYEMTGHRFRKTLPSAE